MPARNFIVAIELGSTKIRGIAGQKKSDGRIDVLAVVTENADQCIRKGVVYNTDKTIQCIISVIQRLRSQLKSGIKHVYIGVGGQSIHSDLNTITKEVSDDMPVTQQLIVDMMDQNRSMEYPEQEILDVEVQEYRADSLLQVDPVGIQCQRLEGNFLNILQRKRHYQWLNSCFEKADVKIAEVYLAPFALADAVLTPMEKRSGCVLVDLGADTTTVMVFYKNIIRHLAVIPLGANNITKDICSLQVEEAEAERMKLRYASAYTEQADIDPTLKYDLDYERKVESPRFIDIVEARVQEIIANVWTTGVSGQAPWWHRTYWWWFQPQEYRCGIYQADRRGEDTHSQVCHIHHKFFKSSHHCPRRHDEYRFGTARQGRPELLAA